MPSTSVLRGSKHLVFAHYFTPYPLSLDNQPAAQDYYTRNYLTPGGEHGAHVAYGGLLRDRPLPVSPQSGDWQTANMKAEILTARAAGIDGFTVDILGLSGQNWDRLNTLIKAADAVDPGFRIVLMPDMTALPADPSALAAALAKLAGSKSVFRLGDGRLVLSPFKAEAQTPQWWSGLMATMRQQYGLDVALVPVFLNAKANAQAFASISYAFSDWGNRSPAQQSGVAANVSLAHSLGKLWMQPVSIQDERPNQGIFDEADNTENLRSTWGHAISDGADWVQLTTWNDFSEGTQFAPSLHNGYAYLDISSYYLTRFKTGSWPAIVRDTVYLTSRVQPVNAVPAAGVESKLMKPRGGTSTPRDDVEVLSFLTAPATVNVTVGGSRSGHDVAAGVQAVLVPLGNGTSSAEAVRNGQTVAAVSSAGVVSSQVAVQDLQYRAASSRRSAG